MDDKTTIQELKDKISKFCDDRDWDQFHNAKELTEAMSIEVGEIMEHFLWKSHDEVDKLFQDAKEREEIEEEMADVLHFMLRFAQRYDIDLSKAIEDKLEKNHQRFPIEKVKGSSKKYNKY